jgi:hypothetical protein
LHAFPFLHNIEVYPESPFRTPAIDIIMKNRKATKDMYETFIESIQIPIKSEQKWCKYLNNPEINWSEMNSLVFKHMKDVKLRWLQCRIIHRIIATNNFLYKIKKVNTPLCTFCKQENETIEHIFYDCEMIKPLWERIFQQIYEKTSNRIELTPRQAWKSILC